MQTKICRKCLIEKELIEFSKDKQFKSGIKAKCKSCYAEYDKEYNKSNKENISKRKKPYYKINKMDILEKKKVYRETPKGRAIGKVNAEARRARIKNADGTHTVNEILALFELQSGKCPYCKTKLHKTKRNSYHCDHIVPLSKGGTNDISNIQLLCPKCNLAKKDKLPNDYAIEHGKLF